MCTLPKFTHMLSAAGSAVQQAQQIHLISSIPKSMALEAMRHFVSNRSTPSQSSSHPDFRYLWQRSR